MHCSPPPDRVRVRNAPSFVGDLPSRRRQQMYSSLAEIRSRRNLTVIATALRPFASVGPQNQNARLMVTVTAWVSTLPVEFPVSVPTSVLAALVKGAEKLLV